MTSSVLVIRPGRGDTGLLLAEARGGRLTVGDTPTVDLPSLTASGEPNRGASAVIAGLLGEINSPPPAAWLVLPPGSTPLRRVEVELPIDHAVQHGQVADALARARTALSDDGRTAVLACRPTGHVVDGDAGEGDPTGRRGRLLTVEVTALCAAVDLLSAFERVLAGAGLTLAGVVSPAEALGATCLPDGEGRAVHVGHGATLAVAARGGTITHQASVPLGRRHLEQDAAEVSALERDAAREAVARVLAGADDPAAPAIRARLAEIVNLLAAARAAAGFAEGGRDVVSGLPPGVLGGVPCQTGGDPLLLGAARLALGLGGEIDQPALVRGGGRRGLRAWLRERF